MNFKNLLFLSLIASALIFQSCDEDDNGTDDKDFKATLENLATNVITATYQDLANKGAVLLTETENFKNDPSEATLDAAQAAWRAARAPWEASEGFLFGPVDTKGIDPAIDDWPVEVTDLTNVLASGDNLTEEYIEGLPTGQKGFHTIEYLLWDLDGEKQYTEFSTRELEYLVATVENLKNKVNILADSWKSSGENFAGQVISAGETGNSLYVSQKAALETIAEAIIIICDEVSATKIASPLGESTPEPVEEESRFSHNSKDDFTNNIRSISNIYIGKYNTGSGGLTEIISAENASLDLEIKTAIAESITAIDAIPGNFSDAIVSNRTEVTLAKDKVQLLKDLLNDKMKPIISAL